MSRIGDWFRRLRGRPVDEPAVPRAAPRARAVRPKPAAARNPASGELSIDEAPPARPSNKPGGAGFDPYSSDAGYQKPHSWERVDHD